MLNNPDEDFMSGEEESEDEEKSKYKDDEIIVDKILKAKNPDKICRICLGGDGDESEWTEDNPLFAPCICSGTMKYVHLECMQQWVHNKRHSKEVELVKSYNWKNLEWELWKHKIHEEFEFNGKKYYLLNYERPKEGEYIVLESFTNTPHKTIHVITVPQNYIRKKKELLIKVGRGTEADVRITDISVSRFHSKIYYYNGEFYWNDNNSKFGTVVLLRQPISLPQRAEHFFQLQVGKHLIEVESESHMNCWYCNITNRINRKYKGVTYAQFRSMLPRQMRHKLDYLGNVTNILETQNVEDAEFNLNREITKMKLANESLISQRTNLNAHLGSIDDGERYGTKEISSNKVHPDIENDNTRLQQSDLYWNMNISDRNVYKNYQDNTLMITNDLQAEMKANRFGLMNAISSRNFTNEVLQKNSSTKDRFDGQQTNPSGNHFTHSQNQIMKKQFEQRDKPKKLNKNLFEEYKHSDLIEEEKKQETIIPRKIYKEGSSDEEEENRQIFTLKANILINRENP
jgi:hypothetical protein